METFIGKLSGRMVRGSARYTVFDLTDYTEVCGFRQASDAETWAEKLKAQGKNVGAFELLGKVWVEIGG